MASNSKFLAELLDSNGDVNTANLDNLSSTLGTASTNDTGDFLQVSNNLSDLNDAPTARSSLGLGTAATTDSTAYATAAQGTTADTALQPTNNLNDLNSVDTALTNLGFSAFGKSLIDDADATALRTTIGASSGALFKVF
jgi:hypothetical protein